MVEIGMHRSWSAGKNVESCDSCGVAPFGEVTEPLDVGPSISNISDILFFIRIDLVDTSKPCFLREAARATALRESPPFSTKLELTMIREREIFRLFEISSIRTSAILICWVYSSCEDQ